VAGERLYFADYLRAALVSLVMLHHIAITYGGSGSWYYVEPATDPVATILFTLFNAFNQTWFLGCFFLISGYFSPGSFDRKGPLRFLKDRLVRLGIPLLVFFFLLSPVTLYIALSHAAPAQVVSDGFTLPLSFFSWQFYSNAVGTGPLWFVELLFIFELGYAALRVARRGAGPGEARPFPTYRMIAAFILVLAASAYLLRVVLPMNGPEAFGFPSLFDLPQYLGFFIVGILAARGDWLMKMPSSMAKRFFLVALVASATLLPLAIIGQQTPSLGWGSLLGYGSLSSALYALFASAFAVGETMFAISFFRGRFNHDGKFRRFCAQNFYAAYMMQATVIVAVCAVLLSPVRLESLLKFGLAAVIAVPATWGVGYLVRRIPYADRVL
jgi:hypothetical protein